MQEALEKVKQSEFWQANRTQLRPWALFFNTQRIRLPRSEEYMVRVRRNLVYYQANYVCAAIGLLAVFILVEPSFLIGLLLIAASYYYLLYQKNPIVVGGKILNETERMVAFLARNLSLTMLLHKRVSNNHLVSLFEYFDFASQSIFFGFHIIQSSPLSANNHMEFVINHSHISLVTLINLWLFSVGADIFYLIFIISFAILAHASMFEAFDEDFGFDKQFGTEFGRSGV